jgi:trehalose-6-phosphate synthase
VSALSPSVTSPRNRIGRTRFRGWERRLSPLGPFDGENRRRGGGRLLIAAPYLPAGARDGSLPEVLHDGWAPLTLRGGMITALEQTLSRRGGAWVGWSDTGEPAPASLPWQAEAAGYETRTVTGSASERELAMDGFCRRVILPLFHGSSGAEPPEAPGWETFRTLNERFARTLAAAAQWDDLIWVHGHPLMLTAEILRHAGSSHRLAFFLPIPFPSVQALEALPWHRELVEALLHFDLLGFRSEVDRKRFLGAARQFVPDAFDEGTTEGLPVRHGRAIRSRAFPLPVDYAGVVADAQSPRVWAREEELRSADDGRTAVLGTSGPGGARAALCRLQGVESALARYPDLRRSVVLDQLLPPRKPLPGQDPVWEEVDVLAQEINERWGDPNWTPVRCHRGDWDTPELLARYRAADVLMVDSFVSDSFSEYFAKEYAAVHDHSGLVLIETGSPADSQGETGAHYVEAGSPDAVADALRWAHRTPQAERKARTTALRALIRDDNLQRWATGFLAECVRAG